MGHPENAPADTPAVPVVVPCPDCGGSGKDTHGNKCSWCKGCRKRTVTFTEDF